MLLSFQNVSYRYEGSPAWAVRDLDFSIPEGEYVLVAGASGSGKSTLCRLATGLAPQFHRGEMRGRVQVEGLDTRQVPVSRLFGHAGLVFQNTDAQLFNRSVKEELAYGLESLGLDLIETEKRIRRVTGLLNLGPLLERSPHLLSGGEKQRVILGAILALQPRLLLLDEPFAHLDPEGAETLRSILKSLSGEGMAVIVVEHRLQEVVADVDRLLVFDRGRLAADGPPRRVLEADVTQLGINLPPLVACFRRWGWMGPPPLTPDEAFQLLRSGSVPAAAPEELPRWFHPQTAPSPKERGHPLVEVRDVRFGVEGREILRGVDFLLEPGECAAVVGRNGAGKTTLVKHLNGLLTPDRGTVSVLGLDTRTTPAYALARQVGFAWQNPNDQLFRTTVREEVLTGPNMLKAYDADWCDRLFVRFGLLSLLERSPFTLSEGEKKRVAFATALAARPELVVLDEPTAGQDEPFRKELTRLIGELRGEGKTVVLVTHDLDFASGQSPRWLVLADGAIRADGSPESIMSDRGLLEKTGLRPTQTFALFLQTWGKR